MKRLKNSKRVFLSIVFIMLTLITFSYAEIGIKQEKIKFRTYGFSEPNPIAKIGRIYPYFRFDRFAYKPKYKLWNMIILENNLIKIWISPEIGGKVWGAIEKASGFPFVYFNKAVKFRDIAMRGPWTSGGIEFNFGSIGHTPNVGTPVDYFIRKNRDNSVSVFVGTMDLTSRTNWQVEIKIEDNKAYFETNTFWFNPTNLDTSLYHWLNNAINIGDDLKYFFQGNYHLDHNGIPHPWPINKKGIDISYYKNNNFGKYKPYHIFGAFVNSFSEVWQNKKIGAGHWGFYTDKPGKKIWIWGLSREGAIWENLLADQDLGNKQYSETQAGLLFIQAGHSSNTPFKHAYFSPQTVQNSRDLWFVTKGLKEIKDVNEIGAFNYKFKNNSFIFEFCPFENIKKELRIFNNDQSILKEKLNLKPLQTYRKNIELEKKGIIKIFLGKRLIYNSSYNNKINRPVKSRFNLDEDNYYNYYIKGLEKSRQRDYGEALTLFKKAYKIAPYFSPVIDELAEIYYRRMEYKKALKYAKLSLSNDAYDPKGNFFYGVINNELGNIADAKDGFSIAGKFPEYRSAAFPNLAEIYFKEKNYDYSKTFAIRSINYNKFNLNAYRILSIIYRKEKNTKKALKIHDKILSFYPLSHFSRFEKFLITGNKSDLDNFKKYIKNEFPEQTYFELALYYYKLGLYSEAIKLLHLSPKNAIINYWLSYLYNLEGKGKESKRFLNLALNSSPFLVFPFRYETLKVLKWAESLKEDWKNKYYIGLIFWSKYRIKEAKKYFLECKDFPDYPYFYITKGKLFEKDNPKLSEKAYLRAYKLAPQSWRTYHSIYTFYKSQKNIEKAYYFAKKGTKRIKNFYLLNFDYADSLYHKRKYKKALSILNKLTILPSEAATFGRTLYNRANIMYAIKLIKKRNYKKAIFYLEKAKLWPEHLGAGKPYNPDERVENYLESLVYEKLGNIKKSQKLLEKIIKYTTNKMTDKLARTYPEYDIIGFLAVKKLKEYKCKDKIVEIINTRTKEIKKIFQNIENSKHLSNILAKTPPDSNTNFLIKILLYLNKK